MAQARPKRQSRPAAGSAFRSDIPSERWLEQKLAWVHEDGRNDWGVPKTMAPVTGSFNRCLRLPTALLRLIPGERGEQKNVRQDSLAYIRDHFETISQEPLYVEVDPYGQAWMSEGNHRVMVACNLEVPWLTVQVRYFCGAERIEGVFSPAALTALDAQWVSCPVEISPKLQRLAFVQQWSDALIARMVSHCHANGLDPLSTAQRAADDLALSRLRGEDADLLERAAETFGFESGAQFRAFSIENPGLSSALAAKAPLHATLGRVIALSLTEAILIADDMTLIGVERAQVPSAKIGTPLQISALGRVQAESPRQRGASMGI